MIWVYFDINKKQETWFVELIIQCIHKVWKHEQIHKMSSRSPLIYKMLFPDFMYISYELLKVRDQLKKMLDIYLALMELTSVSKHSFSVWCVSSFLIGITCIFSFYSFVTQNPHSSSCDCQKTVLNSAIQLLSKAQSRDLWVSIWRLCSLFISLDQVPDEQKSELGPFSVGPMVPVLLT